MVHDYGDDNMALLLDSSVVEAQIIELEPDQIEKAATLSQQVVGEDQQWQTYLNGLAFYGLEQWLLTFQTPPKWERDSCSLYQPFMANVCQAVCNLWAGQLNLCLLVTEFLADDEILIPRSTVELPSFAAHLYVILEVREEDAEVIVHGCLRCDRLQNYINTVTPTFDPDWNYSVPLELIDRDLSHLLAYLNFLDASTLPNPKPIQDWKLQLASMQTILHQGWTRLRSPDVKLWEVFKWEIGKVLLTCPPLLQFLYTVQRYQPSQEAIAQQGQRLLSQLTKHVTNVWYWTQGQIIDTTDFIDNLGWSAPQLCKPAAMRSPQSTLETTITTLERQNEISFPSTAYYTDFHLPNTNLDLSAITWGMPEGTWILQLILCAEEGTTIPIGTHLHIYDSSTLIIEKVFEEADVSWYPPMMEAEPQDELTIGITLPGQMPILLPPFVYLPQ